MDYTEFNFQLENLKTSLYTQLENSKMPLGAIFYLIKDIYNNLQNQYMASLNDYALSHQTQTKIEDFINNNNSQIENSSDG